MCFGFAIGPDWLLIGALNLARVPRSYAALAAKDKLDIRKDNCPTVQKVCAKFTCLCREFVDRQGLLLANEMKTTQAASKVRQTISRP